MQLFTIIILTLIFLATMALIIWFARKASQEIPEGKEIWKKSRREMKRYLRSKGRWK